MHIQQKNCHAANFGGTRSKIEYIVVHWTSNAGDSARDNATYFAREHVGASAHYFVDETEIWQSVPDTSIAWHCGANFYWHPLCRNANSLGVELCLTDRQGGLRQGAIAQGVQLVRALMEQYAIPPDHVLRHYDVTGKHCPGPFVEQPSLWEDFKNQLLQEEPSMKQYHYVQEMPAWAQEAARKALQLGILAMDEGGAVQVWECNLQPLVWMYRAGMMGG